MRPSELLLPYTEFVVRVKSLKIMDMPTQDPLRQWLCAWDACDMAVGPRNDSDRIKERLGHYCGWFQALTWMNEMEAKP